MSNTEVGLVYIESKTIILRLESPINSSFLTKHRNSPAGFRLCQRRNTNSYSTVGSLAASSFTELSVLNGLVKSCATNVELFKRR